MGYSKSKYVTFALLLFLYNYTTKIDLNSNLVRLIITFILNLLALQQSYLVRYMQITDHYL